LPTGNIEGGDRSPHSEGASRFSHNRLCELSSNPDLDSDIHRLDAARPPCITLTAPGHIFPFFYFFAVI
jgi:hypothetical protein